MVANVWLVSALWLGLALLALMILTRMAVSVALIEIMVGAVAGNFIGLLAGWVSFLVGRRRRSPSAPSLLAVGFIRHLALQIRLIGCTTDRRVALAGQVPWSSEHAQRCPCPAPRAS